MVNLVIFYVSVRNKYENAIFFFLAFAMRSLCILSLLLVGLMVGGSGGTELRKCPVSCACELDDFQLIVKSCDPDKLGVSSKTPPSDGSPKDPNGNSSATVVIILLVITLFVIVCVLAYKRYKKIRDNRNIPQYVC